MGFDAVPEWAEMDPLEVCDALGVHGALLAIEDLGTPVVATLGKRPWGRARTRHRVRRLNCRRDHQFRPPRVGDGPGYGRRLATEDPGLRWRGDD
jgi:hypothetical protein